MVSLVSMEAGRSRLMGPGGAAAATGLYSLTGLCAYPLVAGVLLVAVRMCRARRLIKDVGGVLGFLALLCSTAVLLHLPFAGEPVTLRGPGGLFGQWLAENAASVVGGLGTALAAATLLSVSLILLTHVRVARSSPCWLGRRGARVAQFWSRPCRGLAGRGGRPLFWTHDCGHVPREGGGREGRGSRSVEAETAWMRLRTRMSLSRPGLRQSKACAKATAMWMALVMMWGARRLCRRRTIAGGYGNPPRVPYR